MREESMSLYTCFYKKLLFIIWKNSIYYLILEVFISFKSSKIGLETFDKSKISVDARVQKFVLARSKLRVLMSFPRVQNTSVQ